MSNLLKRMIIVALIVTASALVISASIPSDARDFTPPETFYNYIEDQKLTSSRFTRLDDTRTLDEALFVPITANDVFVTENSDFSMYVNEDTLNVKVLNKSTDYVWATAIDSPVAGSYNGLLSSGIGFEYINKQQNMAIRENIGITDTEFTMTQTPINDGVRFDLEIGGFCATRNCSRFYDDYLAGDYTLEQMINFGFTELGFSFSLEITLTEEGLSAHIPFESIVEENTDWVVLSSIILFPGLGATRMDETPGYMVIPDGVGALMRYEDNQRQFLTPFEARFYGMNAGISTGRLSVTSQPLSLPIFGAVHGVDQNAFIGILESGDVNARLLAYPNGAHNLNYNLIFTKFDYKQVYRQSFSSDGSGGALRVAETGHFDVKVHYNFLEGDHANYTGIARDYQSFLTARDVLTPLERNGEDIALHTQYLMADSTTRFFGKSVIEMTSVEYAEFMYEDLGSMGINNQVVSLLGWNKGGYSGQLPAPVNFENSLGRTRDFTEFIEHVNQENALYLVNNYVRSSNGSSRISYRNDVALGVNRFKLERTFNNRVYDELYTLYPFASLNYAMRDLEDYQDIGARVLHQSAASMLYSYYYRDMYTREDSLDYFTELFEAYDGLAAYTTPNAYAFKYTDAYFEATLYNSQLKYFDDLVPLLPIVLSGHLDMYSEFLNYNSLGREQLLAIIDFGMRPSFIVSEARASDLRGSDIEHYYTSSYDVWRDTIIEEYTFINDALRHVNGSSIVARNVLATGIVQVDYSNGVSIVINYTSQNYQEGAIDVDALDVQVRGVN